MRWGADLSPAAEGHFQVDARPGSTTLTRLTGTFHDRSVNRGGPRPGAPDDPATSERLKQARRLARAQGTT